MSWVVAYAFTCDLSLHEILTTLRHRTGWTWRSRDSHFWGDYISATPDPEVIAKIFIEAPGYLFELKFQDDNLRGAWETASRRWVDEILPHIGARDIRRAPANN